MNNSSSLFTQINYINILAHFYKKQFARNQLYIRYLKGMILKIYM